MPIHSEPHPLAGKTVKIKEGVQDRSGMVVADAEYRVEDYWDRVSGGSWMFATGNPAAIMYAIRTALDNPGVPVDNEVLYGKIGAYGHLVHVSEVEE